MSEEPLIAHKGPAEVTLEPGVYLWCRCAKSQKQPFCDASHRGTSFKPMRFEVKEKSTLFLCQCKHTGNAPFCDDTHLKL